MRCIAYVRLSVLTDASTSPERQEADIRRWIDGQGYNLVEVVQDLDVSAYSGVERPGLELAMKRIEAGDADMLVVWKLDRLARRIVTWGQIIERLQRVGAAVASVQDHLDLSTPMGRAFANILVTFAQLESEQIALRVASARRHIEAQGKWAGGRRPYGMKPVTPPDGKGWILVPDDDEIEILRWMAEEVLAGKTLNGIAVKLNEDGKPTSTGRLWGHQSVRAVITRSDMADLIGAPLYAKVLRALSPGSPRTRLHYSDSWVAPLLSCSDCGSHMLLIHSSKRPPAFRCAKASAAPALKLPRITISAATVEAEVERQLLAAFGNLKTSRPPTTTMVDLHAEERVEIQRALDQLAEDRYVRGLFKGDDGDARFNAMYRRLEDRLEGLPGPVELAESDEVTIPTGKSFADAWADSDTEHRSSFAASMIDNVVIHPNTSKQRIQIVWSH